MQTSEFAYWLNGFVELHGEISDEKQWDLIKRHLDSCFIKEPSIHNKPSCRCNAALTSWEGLPFRDYELRTGDYRPELALKCSVSAPGPLTTC